MRCFFDTEFAEDGRTIDLISIGLTREDGEELYLISSDFKEAKVSEWVRENVLVHLPSPKEVERYPNTHIRELVENFFWDDPEPEMWAYYADYDWVAFAQLFGRMIDLPPKFPRYCRDLKQLADDLGVTLPQPVGIEHHALADARWVKAGYNLCMEYKK